MEITYFPYLVHVTENKRIEITNVPYLVGTFVHVTENERIEITNIPYLVGTFVHVTENKITND